MYLDNQEDMGINWVCKLFYQIWKGEDQADSSLLWCPHSWSFNLSSSICDWSQGCRGPHYIFRSLIFWLRDCLEWGIYLHSSITPWMKIHVYKMLVRAVTSLSWESRCQEDHWIYTDGQTGWCWVLHGAADLGISITGQRPTEAHHPLDHPDRETETWKKKKNKKEPAFLETSKYFFSSCLILWIWQIIESLYFIGKVNEVYFFRTQSE